MGILERLADARCNRDKENRGDRVRDAGRMEKDQRSLSAGSAESITYNVEMIMTTTEKTARICQRPRPSTSFSTR